MGLYVRLRCINQSTIRREISNANRTATYTHGRKLMVSCIPVKPVLASKSSLSPTVIFVTDRSNAMVLMWFSVACFGVRVSVMFHLMFVHYTLVRFWLLTGLLLRG